jgi:hypothetical protein
VARDGRRTYLLDTDIDENGEWLLHTFDLIRHAFTGGTHPVDIHECLCTAFPSQDLGYHLEPVRLLPLPPALSRVAAGHAARLPHGAELPPATALPRRKAAKKR